MIQTTDVIALALAKDADWLPRHSPLYCNHGRLHYRREIAVRITVPAFRCGGFNPHASNPTVIDGKLSLGGLLLLADI
jgi:hypothetical protein